MTHICKESTFQAIHHLCFIACLNEFGFGLFQLCDVIIDTDDFYFVFFRSIVGDHHITANPIPFVLCSRTMNTHLPLEMSSSSLPDFVIEIKETFTVFRMHLTINSYNLAQRNIFLLTQVLIPLFNGIAFPVQKIQFGITYLGIVGYHQEEILKITDTIHRVNAFRIVNAD